MIISKFEDAFDKCTSELNEKGKIYHEERKTASHITKCLKMKSGEEEMGVYNSPSKC